MFSGASKRKQKIVEVQKRSKKRTQQRKTRNWRRPQKLTKSLTLRTKKTALRQGRRGNHLQLSKLQARGREAGQLGAERELWISTKL